MTKRIVMKTGLIKYREHVYRHEALSTMVGKQVLVMRDKSLNDATCIVHDENGEFICNATNARRWAAILSEANMNQGGR